MFLYVCLFVCLLELKSKVKIADDQECFCFFCTGGQCRSSNVISIVHALVKPTLSLGTNFWKMDLILNLAFTAIQSNIQLTYSRGPFGVRGLFPPVDLYLISEKSIWKNQVRRTGFLVYFKLDFYCLCSLQKSISKLIFCRLKIQFVELDFYNLNFQKSSTDQQGVSILK